VFVHVVFYLMLLLLPGRIYAQTSEPLHEHAKMERALVSASEPPIKITINPEARVSVTLSGTLPRPVLCGTANDLAVEIVNQGFITSRLEAALVGDVPAGASLDFHPAPLKGVPEERRNLRITLMKPNPTDLTIAFKAHNEIPDIGGRDRIHFVMRCVQHSP
jgi:hypothetical protein